MRKSFVIAAILTSIWVASTISSNAVAIQGKASKRSDSSSCNMNVTNNWLIPPALSTRNLEPVTLRIEAASIGQTCSTARLSYAIRSEKGEILYQAAFAGQNIALSSDAKTPVLMRAALTLWVSTEPNNEIWRYLPNWHAGADQPEPDEPRFTIAPGITRQAFLEVKALGTPVHCFYRDMLSVQCVIYRNGVIIPFGHQVIPHRALQRGTQANSGSDLGTQIVAKNHWSI